MRLTGTRAPAASRARPSGRDRDLSFASLIGVNVWAKKLRFALTSLAVAIGVVAVVSLNVLTGSLQTSAFAIMQMGKADFTVSQRGVADVLSSNIDQSMLADIRSTPGVAAATGVLLSMVNLNSANPVFLEIGLRPQDQAPFGVTILRGASYGASATDQVMLGWRAASNLGIGVGGTLRIQGDSFHVVGIYSTGQAQGDSGAMFPLSTLQTMKRQSQEVTLVFVRVAPGAGVQAVQDRIDRENPQLVTVRTVAQFGRANLSLSLIQAAARGSTLLAVVIGAIVVMSAMSMSFVERMREFGVLSAIGWSRSRVGIMILAEAMTIGLAGAALGSALSVAGVDAVAHLSSLRGVLSPQFTAGSFGLALYTAGLMSLLGGIYPAWRAARTTPMEALRNE